MSKRLEPFRYSSVFSLRHCALGCCLSCTAELSIAAVFGVHGSCCEGSYLGYPFTPCPDETNVTTSHAFPSNLRLTSSLWLEMASGSWCWSRSKSGRSPSEGDPFTENFVCKLQPP